ncbi:MAG: tetratricopeptide repeat protein [Pseudomonadota bacterium]|nr:tetratricopeptide repeat protein [Pseudomonadota bacterium]
MSYWGWGMVVEIDGYKVFIASPGGLEKERKAFACTLDDYNETDALHRGKLFIPKGWEVTLAGMGRPQALINEEICECDYFVLLLHDRWGSPTDVEGQCKYSSGTQEEYHVALECINDPEKSLRQMVVLFKAVDPGKLSDPGPQLSQVLEFKKKLEGEKQLLFYTFDEMATYEKRLRAHLAQWVRDAENPSAQPVVMPNDVTLDVSDARPATEDANRHTGMLAEADALADAGRLTEAEALYARGAVSGNSLEAINAYGHFLIRIGRLAQAEAMFERCQELAQAAEDREWLAASYGNLGIVYRTQGDLDQAEAMHLKSLELDEALGHKEGMANSYGNLGNVYLTRGDLEQAEAMYYKSLEINEALGRKTGMASVYGNLGNVYQTWGDLEQAEVMCHKSLEISEALECKERMSDQYGNLGIVYQAWGDLAQAEVMHCKSLEINEALGRKEGMANQYGNLGIVYKTRGDLERAEAMYCKSLEINEALGRKAGMASDYGHLGTVYHARGDLEQAEAMYRKSLDLFHVMGARLDVQRTEALLIELLDKER